MRFTRFFLLLGVVYATAYGYSLMIEILLPGNVRLALIGFTVACCLLGLIFVSLPYMQIHKDARSELWMLFLAGIISYASIVGALALLHTATYPPVAAYVLVFFFSTPMIMCAWRISVDEKNQRA